MNGRVVREPVEELGQSTPPPQSLFRLYNISSPVTCSRCFIKVEPQPEVGPLNYMWKVADFLKDFVESHFERFFVGYQHKCLKNMP